MNNSPPVFSARAASAKIGPRCSTCSSTNITMTISAVNRERPRVADIMLNKTHARIVNASPGPFEHLLGKVQRHNSGGARRGPG